MPILDANALEFFSRSAEQTRRVGMRLGALMQPGDLICLVGDLGAGKTTLVQGIALGWGSSDRVSSPTFVLVNDYRRPDGLILHHMDAYRLRDGRDAEDLDLTLMLESGCTVMEWPDRIESVLPRQRLWVSMRYMAEEQRGMVFTANGKHYQEILIDLRRKIYG